MRDLICEPITLEAGHRVVVDLNRVADSSPDPDLFFHFHHVCELVFFGAEDIEGHVYIGDRRMRLQPGTLVFMPSMMPHGFDIKRGRRNRLLIQFESDLLAELFNTAKPVLSEAVCVRPQDHLSRRLEYLGLWLLELAGKAEQEAHRLDVLRLILRLTVQAQQSQPGIPAGSEKTSFRRHHRLAPAIAALHNRSGERLSLMEAASLCGVSREHFSRLFRQCFGTRFSAYRRELNLRMAAQYLTHSSTSVNEVAYRSGFASSSHFIADFKAQFGLTPKAYQASYEAWKQEQTGLPRIRNPQTEPVNWDRLGER